MSYLSAIAACTVGSLITTAQAAISNKFKLSCNPKVLSQAMNHIHAVSGSVDTSATESIKHYMVKTAEARDVINNCFGLPLAKEALANKAAAPIPAAEIQAMALKMFGVHLEQAHAPIHISEARDFVAAQAAKVTTTAATLVAKTVETTVQTTTQVATEKAERSVVELIWSTPGLVIGGAVVGLGIYAIYQLFFASKPKSS